MFRILQHFILITILAMFSSHASAMFIQADWYDPANPQVGTNRYAYSHNDPINLADPGGNVPYNPGGSTSTGYHNQDTDYETHTSWTDHSSPDYEQHNYGSNYGGGGKDYGVQTFTGPAHYDGRSQGIGVTDGDYTSTNFRSSGDFSQYSSYDYSKPPGASGQAVNADGVLYGAATLPAGATLSAGKGVLGLGAKTAPRARKSLSAAANPAIQTTAEATKVAKSLGYRKVRSGSAPFNSHGQAVYKKGSRYITRDVDGHNGGAWKAFDRSGRRVGTFNRDLTVRIGD